MKKILVLSISLFCFSFLANDANASNDMPIKANSALKKSTMSGRLPNTAGYVGKHYYDLQKEIPGQKINGEGAIFYLPKKGTIKYGFEQYNSRNGQSKYYVTSKEKTQFINRIYSGQLQAKDMSKLYGQPLYYKHANTKIKLYKSGNFYVGYRSYKHNGRYQTNISVGTLSSMKQAALFNSYQ